MSGEAGGSEAAPVAAAAAAENNSAASPSQNDQSQLPSQSQQKKPPSTVKIAALLGLTEAEEHVARHELLWQQESSFHQTCASIARIQHTQALRDAAARRRADEEAQRALRTTARRVHAMEAEEQKKRLQILQSEDLQLDALLRILEKEIQGDVFEAAYEAAQRMKYFNKTLDVIIKNESASRRDIVGSERYEFLVFRQHADSAITKQQRIEGLERLQEHKHRIHDEYRKQVLSRKESRQRQREMQQQQQQQHARPNAASQTPSGSGAQVESPAAAAASAPSAAANDGAATLERSQSRSPVASETSKARQSTKMNRSNQQHQHHQPQPPPHDFYVRQGTLLEDRELLLRSAIESEESRKRDIMFQRHVKLSCSTFNTNLLDQTAREAQNLYFARQREQFMRDEAAARQRVLTEEIAGWTGVIRRQNREALAQHREDEDEASRQAAHERKLIGRLERIAHQKESFARRSGGDAGAMQSAAEGAEKMQPVFLPQPPQTMLVTSSSSSAAQSSGSGNGATSHRRSSMPTSGRVRESTARMLSNMQHAQRVVIEKEQRLEFYAIMTQARGDGPGGNGAAKTFEEKEADARKRRARLHIEQAEKVHKRIEYEEQRFTALAAQRQVAKVSTDLQRLQRAEGHARNDIHAAQLETAAEFEKFARSLCKLGQSLGLLLVAEENERGDIVQAEKRLNESIRVSMAYHKPVPPQEPLKPLPPPPLKFDEHRQMLRTHTVHHPKRNEKEWEETKPKVKPRPTVMRLQTIEPPNAAKQKAILEFYAKKPPPPKPQPHPPMSAKLDTHLASARASKEGKEQQQPREQQREPAGNGAAPMEPGTTSAPPRAKSSKQASREPSREKSASGTTARSSKTSTQQQQQAQPQPHPTKVGNEAPRRPDDVDDSIEADAERQPKSPTASGGHAGAESKHADALSPVSDSSRSMTSMSRSRDDRHSDTDDDEAARGRSAVAVRGRSSSRSPPASSSDDSRRSSLSPSRSASMGRSASGAVPRGDDGTVTATPAKADAKAPSDTAAVGGRDETSPFRTPAATPSTLDPVATPAVSEPQTTTAVAPAATESSGAVQSEYTEDFEDDA